MGIDYKKILIIQLQPIGDILRTTPVVTKLRGQNPESYIAFLAYDRYAELLKGNPKIDEIIFFNRSRYLEEIKDKEAVGVFNELKDFANRLSEMGFDLVINLHNTYISGILTYLARPGESRGVTINEFGHLLIPPGWLLAPQDLWRSGLNMVQIYLRNAGLDTDGAKLEIYLKEEDSAFREEFLRKENLGARDLLIGLNPGAGVYSKKWPKERFAEVGNRLAREYGARIIIFGGKGDIGYAQEIMNSMKASPINAAGKTTLRQLVSLIQRCNLFITNDSGPMHIASAANAPIVAIFGSSSQGINAPYGTKSVTLQADIPCIPCTKSYCEELECLKSISVEDVLVSSRRILDGLL